MATLSPDFVVNGLVSRGVPLTAALGITGSLVGESNLDPGVNEAAPLIPGSRGGFGLPQWTGPRRRQFEAYAAERGAPLDDADVQLDFLVWEMQNSEAGNIGATFNARTPEEAAAAFTSDFLRPGIPHMDRRISATREIAAAFGGAGAAPAGDFPVNPAIAGGFGAAPSPGGAFPGYGPAPTGAYGIDPRIAGGFAPPAPYSAPTGGSNALASLTPFGAPTPVQAAPQVTAAPRNALGQLSGGQPGNALADASGYALPEDGSDIPALEPVAPPPVSRMTSPEALAQVFAAFAPPPRARPQPYGFRAGTSPFL